MVDEWEVRSYTIIPSNQLSIGYMFTTLIIGEGKNVDSYVEPRDYLLRATYHPN